MPSGRHRSNPTKGPSRKSLNNTLYAYPLPLLLHPIFPPKSTAATVLGLFGLSNVRVINPKCTGVFDRETRSVWVRGEGDVEVLWRRGFFGKGSLSRSEPSWYVREMNLRRAGKDTTAEDITAKRRRERQQFKSDRARAIAAAALEAEQAFAEGREIPAVPSIAIPSSSTWKPTPNTLAVENPAGPSSSSPGLLERNDEADEEEEEEELVNLEHLQLTLPEAFFLAWTLQCLLIIDPETDTQISIQTLWHAFQSVYLPPSSPSSLSTPTQTQIDLSRARFDNPFLINYVLYHHYRSLGWVVKNGLKFCVDYLLYKRGPVFHHAEFALVLVPVYEDPTDRTTSPFAPLLQNVDPFSWSWLSTINRVNSQVQKTLILTYITIPSSSRVPLDVLASPACLQYYSVREVTVRRFIPARMRD